MTCTRDSLSASESVTADASDALGDILRSLVGQVGLKEAQRRVRQEMLREALAVSGGSRRRAAKLLGVTRTAIQKMLRDAEPTVS